jgi:hypothetical protein
MSESTQADDAHRDPLEQRVAALERENERLRDRIDDLEDQLSPDSPTFSPAASDYRDARVLEALDAGDKLRLSTLRSLYLERTDIQYDKTLRDRVKNLVESDAFEEIGHQRWRYIGTADESDR